MKKLITLLSIGWLAVGAASPVWAQNKTEENTKEMRTYYFAFLNKGPNRNQDSLTAAKIQTEHLAYIGQQHKAGKIAIAGPFLDDSPMRGVFILNVKTKEEALAIVNNDPAVKAGRLTVDVRPWYSQPGNCLPD